MRFTIAQMMRLVVYAAVAFAIAAALARVPGLSRNRVFSGQVVLLFVSLSWALISVVILPRTSKKFYFTLWMVVAGVIVLHYFLEVGLFWGQASLRSPLPTMDQIAGEALFVLVLWGLGFLLLAYVLKRIARTAASWVDRPNQPDTDTERPR